MMKTLLTFVLLILGIFAVAQNPSLKERELLVQKDYNNEIYNVNPIFDFASITTSSRSKINFDRDSLSRLNIFTPDMNVNIQPIAYKSFDQYQGNNGFAKVDYGTLNPLHAQAGYVYSKPNYYNLAASFNYDNRNEKEVENKNIVGTEASINMDYYLTNEFKTSMGVRYQRNKYGLFSRFQTPNSDLEDNHNLFHSIGIDLGISSYRSQPKNWNFGITGSFVNWKNQVDNAQENNLSLNGMLDIQFNDKWGIHLQPSLATSKSDEYGDATTYHSSMNISFNGMNFFSQIGIQADRINDTWKVWPNSDIRWNVTSRTSLHIRSDAQSTILGGENIGEINPYSSFGPEKNVAYYRNIDADIIAALSENTSLNVKVAYQNANNDANFLVNPQDVGRFTLELADYERQRIQLGITQEFWADQFSATMMVRYDRYSKNMASLLHRPTLFIAPTIQENLGNDKLSISRSGMIRIHALSL